MKQRDSHPEPPAIDGSVPAEVAIPQLMEEHGHRLYQLGLRICGTPEEAEDLVQETFLLAFRNWSGFRGDSSPATWLYSIASRVCQRTRRLRSGEPRHLESLESLVPGRADRVPAARLAGPQEAAIRAEGRELLSAAISELPLTFRLPLVLKDLAELSVRDVARILDIPEATVKTRVHRARLHLRGLLAERLPDLPDASIGDRRICLDLVQAKLDAMDRGDDLTVPDEVICQRCESLFATLDLTGEVCRSLGRGRMPDGLAEEILRRARTGAATPSS